MVVFNAMARRETQKHGECMWVVSRPYPGNNTGENIKPWPCYSLFVLNIEEELSIPSSKSAWCEEHQQHETSLKTLATPLFKLCTVYGQWFVCAWFCVHGKQRSHDVVIFPHQTLTWYCYVVSEPETTGETSFNETWSHWLQSTWLNY